MKVHATAAGKKVALVNLGCAKNLVDAEVMLGKLHEQGYELTLDPTQADYLIVNTCGFIQSAKDESIDHIRDGPDQSSGQAEKTSRYRVSGAALWRRTAARNARDRRAGWYRRLSTLAAGFRCSCTHRYRSAPTSATTFICIRKKPVSRPRRGTQRI